MLFLSNNLKNRCILSLHQFCLGLNVVRLNPDVTRSTPVIRQSAYAQCIAKPGCWNPQGITLPQAPTLHFDANIFTSTYSREISMNQQPTGYGIDRV